MRAILIFIIIIILIIICKKRIYIYITKIIYKKRLVNIK